MNVENSIVFFGTENLALTKSFYIDLLGLELYKDQKSCQIFTTQVGGMIGFCNHLELDSQRANLIITLLTDEVDKFYRRLRDAGVTCSEPTVSEEFRIYHFFTRDPNGYRLEIQKFL
ncbi:MAG: VOC family protein [Kosmotogaceae bacterium]|nr:VOC family protein [Kosmotogaceae bacterium]